MSGVEVQYFRPLSWVFQARGTAPSIHHQLKWLYYNIIFLFFAAMPCLARILL